MKIKSLAKRIHNECKRRSKSFGIKKKFRDFDQRKQIFGILDVKIDSFGVEKIVGFVVAIQRENPQRIDYTFKYLPSEYEREESCKTVLKSIIDFGGIRSIEPVSFLHTFANLTQSKDYYYSTIFTNFNHDLNWIYDELYRRCLIHQKISPTFIFSEI